MNRIPATLALLLLAAPLTISTVQADDHITVEAVAPAPYSQITFTGGALSAATFDVQPAAYWSCSVSLGTTGGSASCVPALRGAASCFMTGVAVRATGTTGPVGGTSACGGLQAVCKPIVAGDIQRPIGDTVIIDSDDSDRINVTTAACAGRDADASLLHLTPWRCQVSWPALATEATGICILNDP